jgi:ankyrin repeat protein
MTNKTTEIRTDKALAEAMRQAAYNGKLEDLRALLDQGADPNAADENGSTALMESACAGNDDCVKLLLDRGAAIDAGLDSATATTALSAAVWNGLEDTALLLLDRGASVKAKDEDGNPLLLCAAARDFDRIALALVKKGANVDEPGMAGTTPLICAAWGGNAVITRALLDAGARTGITASGRGQYSGETAYAIAMNEHHPNIARMIVEHEAAQHTARRNQRKTAHGRGHTPGL